jgi:branched-chain amino acid transport system substrate-binding protein
MRNKLGSASAALLAATFLAWSAGTAGAQVTGDVVKVGVLNDMSGPYSDLQGQGSAVAAQLAIDDFGGSILGKPIELVTGDLQNKVDVGAAVARLWYDTENVDAIFDVGHSAVALAVQEIARERNRINVTISAGTPALTGENCSPNGFHWTYDNYATPRATALATLKEGGDTWYFITADYAFGHSLEENTRSLVEENGGTVLGAVRAPLSGTDFASYILQAQGSGAKVICLANAGTDFVNTLKQMSEFGITEGGQRIIGLLVNLTDVHSLGLEAAQGLMYTEAFYWDLNDETRAFAERFRAVHGKPPTQMQASAYSAVNHYLKAVEAAGTDDTDKVLAAMKSMPINDFMTKDGRIREDGRVIRDLYLVRVKAPAESTNEWDLLEVVATIKGDDAFRPLDQGGCPLVSKK